MDDIISSFKSQAETHVNYLRGELKGIRTGRAHTGMIENLQITAYGGTKMRLIELASLTVEASDVLIVMPFDPSTITDIEKGILASPLGINPQTQGNRILIRVPPLSEEQRTKYAKLVSQLIEETKNKIRYERDSSRKKVKSQEDEKILTEDDRYRLEKKIDDATTKLNEELEKIKDNKEKEIMSV